jgi:hypothetical protein
MLYRLARTALKIKLTILDNGVPVYGRTIRDRSFTRKWLPTLDTLRNFFYALTADMKLTFELLRQGPLAG